MDMISHLFTLSVITDDFGQTAQFYMARTDHHCESVVQPVLNHLTCMHTPCTAPMHRPGITPNANTTHVPTAGSSAALTKPNQTPTRHPPAQKAKQSYKRSHPSPHEADAHTSHVHKNAPSLVLGVLSKATTVQVHF